MGKIMFFATSDQIQNTVTQFIGTLKDSDNIKIVRADLDNAVLIARGLNPGEIDVIIARGNTATALSSARLPFPIIPILLGTEEIAEAFQAAKDLTGREKPLIGVSGFEQSISNLRALLNLSGIEIRFYPIKTVEDIRICTESAKRDKVDVVISGTLCTRACREAGIPAVEMCTTLDSIRISYNQALEFQKSTIRQKAISEEASLLSRYSPEVLMSIDHNGDIISVNEGAKGFLRSPDTAIKGMSLFSHQAFRDLTLERIDTLAEDGGIVIIEYGRDSYAMSASAATLSNGLDGYILRLESVRHIQENELAIRRCLTSRLHGPSYISLDKLAQSAIVPRGSADSLRSLAPTSLPLLFASEGGCGEALIARAVHDESPRQDMPFITLDCEELCYNSDQRQNTLLGEVFQAAHRGTLFLQNLEKLPMRSQLTLISIIRNRVVAYDNSSYISIDVRIIASCSRKIYNSVHSNNFKMELYSMLSQNCISLLPLRDHLEDISTIFSLIFSLHSDGKPPEMDDDCSKLLRSCDWPGNLYQMSAFCNEAHILCPDGRISSQFLRRRLRTADHLEHLPTKRVSAPPQEDSSESVIIKNQLISADRLSALLERNRGNKTRTAQDLGISRTSLWKCLRDLGIE